MKTILSFLKPYRKRLLFISLIMIADVGGSLLVPTITANMINLAVSQADLSDILVQGIWMLGIALLSGGLTLLGSWLCARLSADFGRDLRVALYDKTLSFSTTDFETFGTLAFSFPFPFTGIWAFSSWEPPSWCWPPPFSLSGRPPAFLNCSRVFWTG